MQVLHTVLCVQPSRASWIPKYFFYSHDWRLNQQWYCLEKLDAYHSSVRCLSFLVKGLTIRMKHNVLTLLDMSSDRQECYTNGESFINISSDTERDEYEWKMIRSGKPKGVGSRGVLVCLFAFFHYLSNTNILVTRGLCVTIQVKDFIFTCVANFRAYLGCISKTNYSVFWSTFPPPFILRSACRSNGYEST